MNGEVLLDLLLVHVPLRSWHRQQGLGLDEVMPVDVQVDASAPVPHYRLVGDLRVDFVELLINYLVLTVLG